MNPRKQKKHFKQLSDHLLSGGELSMQDREWLAGAFGKIAEGENANEVLGLKNEVGHSDYDALKRQQLSLALHWIAGAIRPDSGDLPGLGLSVSAACNEASRIFKSDFKYEGRRIIIDKEYLRQCWYKNTNKHLQNPIRYTDEPDFPYDL